MKQNHLTHSNAFGPEIYFEPVHLVPMLGGALVGTLLLAVVPKALQLKTDTMFSVSALAVMSQPQAAPEVVTPKKMWHPARITWYGESYHGKKTSSGSIFDRNGLTIAVPFRKGTRKPCVPFGTMITLRHKGREVTLKCTDVCPGGTWDISNAGMRALGYKNPMQNLKGEVSW